MCGISGILIREDLTPEQKDELLLEYHKSSRKIKHRGPDRTIDVQLAHPINATITFHRLAIMDPSTKGDMPFRYEEGRRTVYVTANAEIYKFKDIALAEDFKLASGSDCEIIIHLYKKYGVAGLHAMCNRLNSEHAFSILDVDMVTGDYKLILSNDRYGKRPLFTKVDSKGFYYSSEMQGLPDVKSLIGKVERFPARHFGVIEKKDGRLGEMKYWEYYKVKPDPEEKICNDVEVAKKTIRELFIDAVVCRLESDRPIGCLLSGGLDSSLVSAVAARYLRKFGRRLRTFSIGIKGTDSIDRPYAEKVAKFIDSEHTFVEFTEQQFLEALVDVIITTGTFDITTIRASTGQYLISKWISENTDVKVLFCGDFSDETNSAYLYSFFAPTPYDLHLDAIRLINDIHFFDGLRADRATSRWGIELRLPFGDHRLVDYTLRVAPELRTPHYKGIEKWLLRAAFEHDNILPHDVLFRIKSAFSDSIASKKRSWVSIIKEMVETKYTEEDLKIAQTKYVHLPPISKESLYYREVFCAYYGENISVSQTIPYFWMPKWCDAKDPSARVLSVCKEGVHKID
ncbi:MAG: asparagine synthase [Harvfovirus sp.]|uniref:asparagine synthase (glutamine-hydrolyzing) n=1 Tax=Harvfovirus sp. TaxID=2487768 RepID=A0A3G5A159_9VIRU|nr:MAG: asparagine synthase [Harvfovirus sp.]